VRDQQICGSTGLWPYRFVAVQVCGRTGLWPYRFVSWERDPGVLMTSKHFLCSRWKQAIHALGCILNDLKGFFVADFFLSDKRVAIVQAGAYINENGIVFADYLSLLADQEEDVIDLLSEEFEDDGRYYNVKNPVATTWLISFEQIRHRDPLAADYLSFIAYIDPKNIPQSLLLAGVSRKKETDAMGTLDAYSFIIRRSANLALDLHRLVHLATRNWLRKKELITQWTERAIARLEEVFPDHDHKNRSVWRTYLPHAGYALISDVVHKDGENRINLAWRFEMCLFSDGRFNEAEVPFMEVMERRKRVLGAEHPSTLTSMNNLDFMWKGHGRDAEALKLIEKCVLLQKRVLGVGHPYTLL
jgi:hypothetical protein